MLSTPSPTVDVDHCITGNNNPKQSKQLLSSGDNKKLEAGQLLINQEMRRPAAIEVDLWEMSHRKRVHEVLGAADFRSELEQMYVYLN